MKRFMFIHFGFEKPTPEIMDAWSKWFESMGDRMVDQGGFHGGAREISDAGTKDLPTRMESITGFNIINTESLEQAEQIARTDPYIGTKSRRGNRGHPDCDLSRTLQCGGDTRPETAVKERWMVQWLTVSPCWPRALTSAICRRYTERELPPDASWRPRTQSATIQRALIRRQPAEGRLTRRSTR